jgi:hypothetical protein
MALRVRALLLVVEDGRGRLHFYGLAAFVAVVQEITERLRAAVRRGIEQRDEPPN